ncbi:MAG: MBL fold metallo-hydrolase [Bacteroidota bacterium]
MALPVFLYAIKNEASVYESVLNNVGKKVINKILSGTYVTIKGEAGDFYQVATAGPDGWMKKGDLGPDMGIKIFYLDVGQGDGALIEIGNLRILIDAGPANNMHNYLTKWQYTYLLNAGKPIHIDHVFISHFDLDHYKGFIKILQNKNFTFGTIYHPGILKFAASGNPYNSGLGNLVDNNGNKYLTKVFDNLLTVAEPAAFNRDITNFMEALLAAKAEQRVAKVKRLAAGDSLINKVIEGHLFSIAVLGPFTEKISNKNAFRYFKDDGITINGHSLVLRFSYGSRSFLFGGDLNTASENYLMTMYPGQNPFEVDVAKSCHHGSSDFTEAFMQLVNPLATVISSGDNESFSHPRADAIGCAGKYSRGARPLVYSTELARSVNLVSKELLFGMINLRCNGNDIFMSQMKEARNPADLWDSYEVS